MSNTPNSDQWKLEGRCSICRRDTYCRKECKKHEYRRKAEEARQMQIREYLQMKGMLPDG